MDNTKEYFAFISYKREDEKWAKWLQHKLEHYKLPSNLNGRTDLPKEIRPIFRDQSELAAGVLADEINKALTNSKYLIVICSPRAAQSQWVGKEVQTFVDLGRTDKIIPFIIGGTAHAQKPEEECFPLALLNMPLDQELLGINIDEMGRDAAAVKVVAQMFGLGFDVLWQRYEREKRFRRIAIIVTALLVAAIGVGAAVVFSRQNKRIIEQKKEIEQQSKDIQQKNESLLSNSKIMAAQMDSINRRDALIELQRDSILITNMQLTIERDKLQQSNWNLKEYNTKILSEAIIDYLQSGELVKAETVLKQMCKDAQIDKLKELTEMERALRMYYRYKTSEGVNGLFSFNHLSDISFLQLSTDGNSFYVGRDERIWQYDTKTGDLLKEMKVALCEDNELVQVLGFDENTNSILYFIGNESDETVSLNKKNAEKNTVRTIPINFTPEPLDYYVSPNLEYFVYSIEGGDANKKEWHFLGLFDDCYKDRIIPNCERFFSFSNDNSQILVLIDGEYTLFDLEYGVVIKTIPCSRNTVNEKDFYDELTFGYNDKLIVVNTYRAEYHDDYDNPDTRFGSVELYSIDDGEYLEFNNPIKNKARFVKADLSSDGNFLVTMDSDGVIRYYEIDYGIYGFNSRATCDLLYEINVDHYGYCSNFEMKMVSGDGIMLTEYETSLKVWDVNLHSRIYKWLDSYEFVSPFGTSYITQSPNYYALYDAHSHKKLGGDLFEIKGNYNEMFKYIDKNNQVVVTANKSKISVWYPETRKCLKIPTKGHSYSLKLSIDDYGQKMIVYEGVNNKSRSPVLSVYDIENNHLIYNIDSLMFLPSFCISPDGTNFVVAESENLYVYDLVSLKLFSKKSINQFISGLSYSPDGSFFVSFGREGVVCLWKTKNLCIYKTIYLNDVVKSCSISPDNRYIVVNTEYLSDNRCKYKSYILNVESEHIVEILEDYSECEFCRVGPNRLIVEKEGWYQYMLFPTLDESIDFVKSPPINRTADDLHKLFSSPKYKILKGQ